MGFKSRQNMNDFYLPGYTIRGIRNEQLLALHYLKQSLHVATFNRGIVKHL